MINEKANLNEELMKCPKCQQTILDAEWFREPDTEMQITIITCGNCDFKKYI